MKKSIFLTLILSSLMIFTATILHAGYTLDPWGSRTWTGQGRPPHWSPEPAPQTTVKRDFKKPVKSDQRVRVPHRLGGKGLFWKDRNNVRHNHYFIGSQYYQVPRVERVIIEREKRIPVYIPVHREPAKLQCGGDTITRNDPVTGELIIEYVSSARDC